MKYPKYLKKGEQFGRWTIDQVDPLSKEDDVGDPVKPSIWKYFCICECGNVGNIVRASLVTGQSQSCGCLKIDSTKTRNSRTNVAEVDGECVCIHFRNSDEYTIIDVEDYNSFVQSHCWYLNDSGYALTNTKVSDDINTGSVRLHRYLMGDPIGLEVDHKDGNPLNNTKSNLRVCTRLQNSQNVVRGNKSGYHGVYFDKRKQKYRSYIGIAGKYKHLGNFDTVEEAYHKRIEAEQYYFGEFAPSNSREENVLC